jgi:hypothetical protein
MRVRDLAARDARALHRLAALSKQEGAGKTGCTLHPRSRVRCYWVKMHTSIQVQRRQSGLPCAVVDRLIARSPRCPAIGFTHLENRLFFNGLARHPLWTIKCCHNTNK